MLEDAVRGVADEIREAAKDFEAAGERIQKRWRWLNRSLTRGPGRVVGMLLDWRL